MTPSQPALPDKIDHSKDVTGVIERVISAVPAPRTRPVEDAAKAAEELARAAARQAALLSGSMALPPGPLGMLTVLPELYLIWKVQRQMVADIFALHDRTAELTSAHMLFCLFRHLASQVFRDVAVRAGERVLIQQLSSGALKSAVSTLGSSIAQRLAGKATSRWIPVVGAAAVGAYAYWDTLQVAKTARNLLEEPADGGVRSADSAMEART
jgi:hypothetical protein